MTWVFFHQGMANVIDLPFIMTLRYSIVWDGPVVKSLLLTLDIVYVDYGVPG